MSQKGSLMLKKKIWRQNQDGMVLSRDLLVVDILPGAVIPMQRVGVSVLRQRARARWWAFMKTSRLGIALMSFLVVLLPYFLFNIKLPFWDIDGATPSYLPTSINQPNQNMPQSIMQRIPLWHVTLSKMVAETSTLLIAWKWKALQGWLPNYPKNRKVEEISIKPFLHYSLELCIHSLNSPLIKNPQLLLIRGQLGFCTFFVSPKIMLGYKTLIVPESLLGGLRFDLIR